MENTKLIDLLRTFDSKELRAFNDFVQSPFFNKNQDLISLFQYLKKWAPKKFPEEKIERHLVFKAIYPKTKYDEKQFNHTTSLLFKLAERFIGIRQYECSGILSNFHILESYVDRNLEKHFRHGLKQLESDLAKDSKQDASYYYQAYLAGEIGDRYFFKQKTRKFDPNLQEASNNLDIFFLLQKLRYLCTMLDREEFISSNYQHTLLEEIKQILASGKYQDIPTVEIYYQLLLSHTSPDPAPYFEQFRKLLEANRTLFSKAEFQNLYYSSINFCIHQIRYGKRSYAKDLMNLYEVGIQTQILLEEGHLSPQTYKNVVKLGLGLKRFEWVERFIKEYTDQLGDINRQEAYHFSLADLYYNTQDFDRAQHHLNQLEFNDIHYNIGAKAMLLRIYFENHSTEAFLSLISSFKIFLKRNRLIPKNVKEPYENFIRLIYQIHKYGKGQYPNLKEEIKQTKALNARSWLMQQLEKTQ